MNKVKIKSAVISALILILISAFGNLNAQSFSASVNSTTVGVNEPFQVSFQFNGDDVSSIRNFKAPDFKGFRVLSGPNQSQSVQIINGSMSASLSFSYYIQASNTGNAIIGPASLDFKGKTYRTQSIKLNVIKGQAPQNNNQAQGGSSTSGTNIADNVFIRAVADKQKVLKGEQVTVTYKLYTRYDISSPQISKLPSYQGFWSEELETSNRINFTTEVVNGKQYHVGILKKAALFPTQTGDLSVTPFELKIPVVVPRQQRRRGNDIFDEFFNDPFFNQGQTVEYNAKSNTIKVTVLPLPQENVPASFKGAVGQYTLSAVMDKNTVKENEPVSLKINITGTGNVNLIDLPEIKLPAGFEKYEPKVNTQVNRASNTVTGQKTIEYLIVPRIQGQRIIEPVEFTYFNPGTKKYVTLKSPEFNLNIEKGDGTSNQTAATGFNKEDVKLLGEDIRFIKTSSGDLSKEGEYTLFSFWFWTLSVLPLIALGGVIAYKKKQDKLSGNVQLMRYQRAEKMARNRLKAAQKSLEAKDQKSFYSEISLALFGYIEDKFHIPKAEFTVDHAVEVLHNNKVPEAMVAEVRNSLEKCEYARFAPVTDGISAMNEMYENAVRIIVELEKGKMKNHQSYMKLSVFIFMLLFSQASLFASSAAEDLMNRANTHYQNGRYEQAVELYQQVIKEGYSGKTLYYNLGNAYFKSGRLGYAILNYEKALKLDPNDEDAAYNLRIANARTVDKIEVMPKLFFVRWWEALLNMFTVNGWTLITFIIYLLLLISTGIYFIAGSQTMQKVSVLTGALTAFLFLCSVLFLLLKYNNDTSRESGIIVEPASTAKLSPDSKSGDAFIIHEGIKVDLEDNVADWVKIKLADGKVGWVPGSDLKKI